MAKCAPCAPMIPTPTVHVCICNANISADLNTAYYSCYFDYPLLLLSKCFLSNIRNIFHY